MESVSPLQVDDASKAINVLLATNLFGEGAKFTLCSLKDGIVTIRDSYALASTIRESKALQVNYFRS